MEKFCPICGALTKDEIVAMPGSRRKQHRCPRRFVRAHDAAMESEYDHSEQRRPFAERLADGFRMLKEMGG